MYTDSFFIFDLIQSASALATVGAFFFIWKQYRQTQQEIDHTLRPWIGVMDKIEFNVDKKILNVPLKNFGRIPAKLEFDIQFENKDKFREIFENKDKFREIFENKDKFREIFRNNIPIQKNKKNYSSRTISFFPDSKVDLTLYPKDKPSWYGYMLEYSYAKNGMGLYLISWYYDKDDEEYYRESEFFL